MKRRTGTRASRPSRLQCHPTDRSQENAADAEALVLTAATGTVARVASGIVDFAVILFGVIPKASLAAARTGGSTCAAVFYPTLASPVACERARHPVGSFQPA
eukprot:4424034-Alexandrium_andersonii.AAC.1